ncbi:MAG TPA: response regulator transcription factor [Solirubrobacteraceae bacterium]|nr:response regulator transcription factor [Solirubrobacteraceae bacterium]
MPELILVIEDESAIVDFVDRGLRAESFLVESASDGIDGTARALDDRVDLVLLDMMLPGRSGSEVLATIRQARPTLPVIVLTARGEVEDRVAGLDAGAVDYLVKPFELAELVARIRAQLRVAHQAPTTTVHCGDIELNLITREVRHGERDVRLSTIEFELLAYLVHNRGRVLSRAELLSAVWGYDHDPGTNVVDVYVGYLRRKLSRDGLRAPITTVRSVGYRIDDAD